MKVVKRRKFCQCGCGQLVNNKYVRGHSLRMKIFTNDYLKKLSIAQKKRYENPEERKKTSEIMKVISNTPEQKIKRALAAKISNSPEINEKRKQTLKVTNSRPEVKKRRSDIQKIIQNRPEVKEKHSKSAKITNNLPGAREKRSVQCIARYNDPEYYEKWLASLNTEEVKKNSSLKQKKNWENPEYIKKQMKARLVKQNKAELKLENLLGSIFPNEYKFVGDGQVIIAGKCPDFINVNGQKKIIELWGDYWHKDQDPINRMNIFKPFGYQTLVIWEKEFKNFQRLKAKIINFNKENYVI